MNVRMIRCTPGADELAGWAAGLCYDSENEERSLNHAMNRSHFSVLEHACFTFEISDVSRALLAQISRHRIASFSVQSMRYVSMKEKFRFVTPPSIASLGPKEEEEYQAQMWQMHDWYMLWQERLIKAGHRKEQANEDARFVLPLATCTHLAVTMNARELLHFFNLRCCRRAQWEIRDLAWEMLKLCQIAAPKLFEKAGPSCVSGTCPEGSRSCKGIGKGE